MIAWLVIFLGYTRIQLIINDSKPFWMLAVLYQVYLLQDENASYLQLIHLTTLMCNMEIIPNVFKQ